MTSSDNLKKAELELKNTVSRLEKQQVRISALQIACDQYQEVTEAAASMVDLIMPAGNSRSHEAVIKEMCDATRELPTYVRNTASTYVTHVLSFVKALKQDQDTTPFAKGRVEEQVEPTTQAIMKLLEF